MKAHLDQYGEEVMMSWVADEINREIETNEEQVQQKATRVTLSIVLSVLTITLLAVATALWLT